MLNSNVDRESTTSFLSLPIGKEMDAPWLGKYVTVNFCSSDLSICTCARIQHFYPLWYPLGNITVWNLLVKRVCVERHDVLLRVANLVLLLRRPALRVFTRKIWNVLWKLLHNVIPATTGTLTCTVGSENCNCGIWFILNFDYVKHISTSVTSVLSNSPFSGYGDATS